MDRLCRLVCSGSSSSSSPTPRAATTSSRQEKRTVSTPKPPASEKLVLRIRQRDWDAVRHRIASSPGDVRFRTRNNKKSASPLHVALMHRAPRDVVRLVVDADPSALLVQDAEGWTPLHVSILYGGDDATTLLLIRRGGYDAASLHSQFVGAPLHLACRHGSSTEVLRALIDANPAQICTPNETGSTPASLLWKTHFRHEKTNAPQCSKRLADELFMMVEATLDRKQDWYHNPTLHDVVDFQHNYAAESDCVSLFVGRFPDSPKRYNYGCLPLHTAASYGYSHKMYTIHCWFPDSTPSDPMNLLLERYPDAAKVADASGRLPLHLALGEGRRTRKTGAEDLVRIFPQSLSRRDPKTSLLPFQLAAVETTSTSTSTTASGAAATRAESRSKPVLISKDESARAVDTIFLLLLACPEALRL